MRSVLPRLICVALCLAGIAVSPLATAADAPQQRRPAAGGANGVFKASVSANWFANNTKFWYRNDLRNQTREFILVDADAGTRARAFDHAKLAAALAQAAGIQVDPDKLPFDAITLTDDVKTVRFTANNVAWKCDLGTYAVTKDAAGGAMVPEALGGPAAVALRDATPESAGEDEPVDSMLLSPQIGRPGRPIGGIAREAPQMPVPQPLASPDRKNTALVRTNNVFLRAADGTETQVTKDGTAANAYARLYWSPDSKVLIAYRQELGAHLSVYHILSSPQPAQGGSRGGVGREVLSEQAYDLPGDKLDTFEMNLVNIASGKVVKPETGRWDMQEDGEAPGPQDTTPHWMEDGVHFLIERVDRGHQRLRVFNINAQTGETKAVIDEQTKTFIWTANRDGQSFPVVNMLLLRPNARDRIVSNEIIYASEKSGYRHLYLINATTGETKPIDHGDWVLRDVDFVDQQKRQIWFMASGVYPDQDPYLIQYGHINFDGTDQVFMTAGNGNHHIVDVPAANSNERTSYSADNKYVIDTYGRVDLPPVTELRRVADGKLVVVLEKADVPATWAPPEVFVAKGRDDKTDIWGIIVRPVNFDASKKYPIIEDIYAGPQGSFVPKTFSVNPSYRSLTSLGFIVVKMDGMGTANRSKAFHDVCWQNLADAGFPDRIKWIKAAAAKYPYMDLNNVGIYGTSAGGQNACGAVLFHPEFYKAAVANSGCHDNRMDKVTWNEEWMGYPVGPQYAASSNIDNAYRLQGHLQLVLGEQDNNVPPESTFRLVDALNRANKDFEFVFIPGADHGAGIPGENVVQNQLQDFFVRYLLHQEPPNRNQPRGG